MAFSRAVTGQESRATEASGAPIEDEIVVRGRAWGEQRRAIELAEEAVYARFNDINSDDRFDIVCRSESRAGSRIPERVCQSLAWREQNANIAQAIVMGVRGEATAPPESFLAEQQRTQRLLADEMRRLAYEDQALAEAVQRLGRAQLALAERAGSPRPWSSAREVLPGDADLPYGARRMLEVQMGRHRWNHRLAYRTFEVAHVEGNVRRLEVRCDEGRERRRYDGNFAWTVPTEWNNCDVIVDATYDTTFVLYEFD